MALGDAFEVDSGSYSPESLKLRRRLAETMLQQGMQSGPVGHWSQGLNRVVQAMLGGYQMNELERKEAEQQRAGNEALLGLLGPMPGGAQPLPSFSSPPAAVEPPRTTQNPDGTISTFVGEVGPSALPDPNMAPYAKAIAGIETPGSKDPYRELGPVVRSGDRAYGKYQVMGNNIPSWTKEILGREMSPQEFLNSPEAQEQVFAGKFGQYLKKTGSPQDAASMWFTGQPASVGANRRAANPDGSPLGITGAQYVEKFSGGLDAGPVGAQPAPQESVASAPAAPELSQAATPEVKRRIAQLLSNPQTRPLGMAMLQRYVVPSKPMTALDQAELAQKQAQTEKIRADIEKQETDATVKVTEQQIEDRYKLQDVVSGIDNTFIMANDLINHPGTPGIAGRPMGGEFDVRGTGINIADLSPGTSQADAFNKHKTLISNVVLRTMERLKAASAQGATGFGALSEKELKVLQDSAGNLQLTGSYDELIDNYKEFQKDLLSARARLMEKYQTRYGSVPSGIMSVQDLINSATGEALSDANTKQVIVPKQLFGFDIPFTAKVASPTQ